MMKHMMPRINATDDMLRKDMDALGEQMDKLTHDDLMKLVEEERTISGMDLKLSRIDAIQAELWRRSQMNKAE